MLFRDREGKIIEIIRKNYTNDIDYFKDIIKTKIKIQSNYFNNNKNEFERIISLIQKNIV